MDFSNSLTFRIRPEPAQGNEPVIAQQPPPANDQQSRCPNLASFLAICLSSPDEHLGLHPVLTNATPDLDDVSLRGGSFDVRRVKASSFPPELSNELFRSREFVVVKHPRPSSTGTAALADVATELQVLRHAPIRSHANVIDLLAVMYHDAGVAQQPVILPALVLEYAAFGSLKTFQEEGHGHSFEDKMKIAVDTARGIEALHACGIVHGDVKTSNMLVCKHATRGFIVKVSDFGFSIAMSDPQLAGHTEIFCPPESYHGRLEPEHAKKLDVYCYGLLLHSVLKDGTAYYPQGPEVPMGTSEDFTKIKVSGLMPSTLVLNVLLTGPGREAYPLLLLCKILLYSLQPEPKNRIHDMSTIVFYLSLLEGCGSNGTDSSDKASSEKVAAMLETVTQARKGAGNGGASILSSLTTVIRAMLSTMPGQTLPADSDLARQFLTVVSTFTDTLLNNFITAAAKLEIPMFESVSAELRSRAQKQISQILQAPEQGAESQQQSFSVARLCQLLLDCAGLFTDTDASETLPGDSKQALSKPQFSFFQGHNLIPDFSLVNRVFQKMPWSVQKAAVHGLTQLHNNTTESTAKSKAALSLASIHANGIGIESDVDEASRLTLEAAALGNEDAQTIYINGFSSKEQTHPQGVDLNMWQEWLSKSAEAGNKVAQSRLRSLDSAALSTMSKTLNEKEFTTAAGTTLEQGQGLCAIVTDDTPNNQLKGILLSAIIEDERDVVDKCLERDEGLLLTRYNNGEHALLIACRLKSVEAAQSLVSPENANLGDDQGVRPLHWLSRDSEHYESLAKLLIDNGADINAIGPALYRSDHEQRVQIGRARWTPLHWAVAFDNKAAIVSLLSLGCDATLRAEPDRGTWDLSALELASSLCHSSALAALLTSEAVKSQVDKPRPMVDGLPVYITPLFYVLSSRSRWERIRQHGMCFEQKTRETISLLVEHGARTDRVLQSRDANMPAAFATAYHACCADVMASGLKLGFGKDIEATCGALSSGGSALFLAITHRDRAMFTALVEAGARLSACDRDGMTPLHRAAKENDDVFFARALLDAGVAADSDAEAPLPSPFQVAVFCRNYNVAKLLFDAGANRHRMGPKHHRTILGDMLMMHTWNSLERVKFLLDLPDAPDGSDGFIGARADDQDVSVLHLAASHVHEASGRADNITTILMTQLLHKYNQKQHLDSTCGPFNMTALAVAVEVGDHGVVRKLLEAGADANVPDRLGRVPLDLVYRRYCFPENLPTFDEVDGEDKMAVARALSAVNENTGEVLSLLKSYGAEARTFYFPLWHQTDSGYRDAVWVMERLKEKKDKGAAPTASSTQDTESPLAGKLPQARD
ncbi:hypothetical protein CDD81_1468 [Ophiocordyceps australis]|uniref:Protein kinase domain-containing protein n=1 Tax=Ophiocordyceps australis TaxID=1399860 RepID=A0A2C5YFU4_9HYPO|nr:hypothetical protein CDD81_1468 [Ophiocordyceps australis]